MIEEALSGRGFQRTLSEEPREDYWILEGVSPSLLVEREGSGWRICRSPTMDEPQGQWVDVAEDLPDDEVILMIDAKMSGH